MSLNNQPDLFTNRPSLPEGFRYCANLIQPEQEQALLEGIRGLPFREFEFHGFLGKRRVVSFGWHYDFNGGGLRKTEDMPEYLMSVRDKAGAFAGIAADELQQVLVTEYRPGAAIGWAFVRRRRWALTPAPCKFRFRLRSGVGWDRASLTLLPRSIYLLRGPSRTEWEHSIPAVDALRYSLTFRNVLDC